MLRYLTAGESHGPCLTVIIEGLPAGLPLTQEEINHELARRQQGYGRGGRMAIEHDQAEILSGVRFGETLGSPVTLRIENRDWQNWQDRMAPCGAPCGEKVTAPRPGHADLTGVLKYDRRDVRDILERASARETAARVAVGAVCRRLLEQLGITITSHVVNIGGVSLERPATRAELDGPRCDLNCIDQKVNERMKQAIDAAKRQGDSLGGIFEVVIFDVPAGLGSYVQADRRLDGRLAGAMVSIQAIKGVEFGAGFAVADLPGSQVHDEITHDETGFHHLTNRSGGIEGGMSNGEAIVVRAVMKPIPTLMKPLATVDLATGEKIAASKERSDVCAVSAASVVGEAAAAIEIAAAVLEKFGGDCLADLHAAMKIYQERIQRGPLP